jgi:hypothetical protein
MKTCVFTPTHETGILMADSIPYAGSHDTRLGRESSWPLASAGTHVFSRPLRVKGFFCALAGRAAFLFRRNSVECGAIEVGHHQIILAGLLSSIAPPYTTVIRGNVKKPTELYGGDVITGHLEEIVLSWRRMTASLY